MIVQKWRKNEYFFRQTKIGKGVQQGWIFHPMKCRAGWITSWKQDGQEKYQQPQICRLYHSNGRNWRGTKEPLDESERGEWKVGLKLNIKKTRIMASGPITSWKIDGETVSDFIFLGSKITADGDCSRETKRQLLLGRKARQHRPT